MKGHLNSFDFSVKCADRLNYFPQIAANFINSLNIFACVYTGHVQTTFRTHAWKCCPLKTCCLSVCAENTLITVLKLYEIMLEITLKIVSVCEICTGKSTGFFPALFDYYLIWMFFFLFFFCMCPPFCPISCFKK